jgi:hypothetical protein
MHQSSLPTAVQSLSHSIQPAHSAAQRTPTWIYRVGTTQATPRTSVLRPLREFRLERKDSDVILGLMSSLKLQAIFFFCFLVLSLM